MQCGILIWSQEQKEDTGEEKFSFTLLGSLAGLKNYTDLRLLTEEKHTPFTKFLPIRGGLHKRMKTLKK